MYAFMVFAGLALAIAVIREVVDEVVPLKTPKALATTVSVGLAILVAWALNYSTFKAFGQPLRSQWMNPVATGAVLVGAGEFLRAIASGITNLLRGGPASGTPAHV